MDSDRIEPQDAPQEDPEGERIFSGSFFVDPIGK